jgi:predicted chitinase
MRPQAEVLEGRALLSLSVNLSVVEAYSATYDNVTNQSNVQYATQSISGQTSESYSSGEATGNTTSNYSIQTTSTSLNIQEGSTSSIQGGNATDSFQVGSNILIQGGFSVSQPATILVTGSAQDTDTSGPSQGAGGAMDGDVYFFNSAYATNAASTLDQEFLLPAGAGFGFQVYCHSGAATPNATNEPDPSETSASFSVILLPATAATAATTTVLTASPNPSAYGQPVTFTATVSPASAGGPMPTPTGNIIFTDGATVLNPGGTTLDTSGTATFSTSSLAVASHSIMAVYSGDSNYSGSTSAPVTQVVNNVPNVTITSISKLASSNLVGPQLEFGYQISGIGILGQFTVDLYQSAKNTFDNSAILSATQTITVSSSPTGYFNLANVSPNPSQPYLLVVAVPPFGGPPSIANQQSYNYVAPNLITLIQLELIMPGLPQNQAQTFIYALNEALADYSINTPNRIAAFLSQIAAESGQLTMWDQSETGATGTYRGRGPIQLTGSSAYSAAGVYFGIDLVDNPGLLADSVNNYELGFEVSGWYWTYYKSYANLNAAADAIPLKTAANFIGVATFENLDITLVVTGQISLPLLPKRLLTLLNAINILT